MAIDNIPKSFWHILSICMLVITLGLVIIAYRSSTVSIEIADAKINLSSAISTARKIKTDLELENERLRAINEKLKLALNEAQGGGHNQDSGVTSDSDSGPMEDGGDLSVNTVGGGESKPKPVFKGSIINPKDFELLNMRINKVEELIRSK